MLYTNARSLNATKIDELQTYATAHKVEVICISETWLDAQKETYSQLQGFYGHFCNRLNRMGGGVAIYTKNCLNAEVVESYTSQKLSAIWVKVAISTTSNIIYVCVYHPPDASDNATLEYLTAAAAKVNELHKNCPLVITGDFNRLNIESITLQLGLESKVNFPTRELVKLDDILTDVADYEPAEKVSPLSRNDHCCILLKKKTKPATGKYTE